MEEDKNIRLTVVRPSEEEDELTIDLSTAFDFLKRFFTVWLAVSVTLGAFLGGVGILWRDKMPAKEATAVISFVFDDRSSLLTPSNLDVQKITSTGVVAEALDSLGIPLDQSDDVRVNLSIEGIIPDSVIDQRTVFFNLMNDADQSMQAADRLLNMKYTTSQYVLSFDYQKAEFTRNEGREILNAVIESYRNYFMETYTKRPLLGSMGSVIDYRDYDYAEAVGIFNDSLNNTLSFLDQYQGGSFRSSLTGYTVADLIRQTETIQSIDLARISAFVTKNCVARESLQNVVSRYEWRMMQNREQRSVEETRLASLTAAVDNYQKDPQLYMFSDGGAVQGPGGELNGVYDDLVSEMLSVETTISNITRINRFYQAVVEEFQEREGTARTADIERVEQGMAALNEKIKNLADTVNKTMDDYFDATLSSLFLVQMPAVAEATPIISKTLIKIVVIAELIPLFIYFGGAVWSMFSAAKREADEKKREADEKKRERTVAAV